MQIVCDNKEIDVVVEVIGGTGVAKKFIEMALYAGKAVVTANKELIAKHWCELEKIAKENNAGLYFEASCVGGVPIIRVLNEAMQANNLLLLKGIINGTTNFILSKMTNEGLGYEEVLKEAQANGFAEANPTADVEGFDAAYKLSILSSLAFNKKVPLDKIYREGISNIDITDIKYGQELGYTLKLLAIAKDTDKGVEARVHPAFVKNDNPLASVNGPFNAVLLNGDMVDDIMLYGRGAGSLPTGSAIVSDIIFAGKSAEHKYSPFENTVEAGEKTLVNQNFETRYYLRITTENVAGVLKDITSAFVKYSISITSLLQKEATEEFASIIFITNTTSEQQINSALEEINKLKSVKKIDAKLRVE
ncbi:MAG: homoserine dehydrogenase [Clostridia bacterium]|nr:homoserine dehydrogenase [Clostridia bacterium]